MIRYLHGLLIDKNRNQLVIEVNGVGFNVFVTPPLLTQAILETDVVLHISESIREDAHDLFGFLTTEERDLFESLRKVPGVGPKVALGICGFYMPADVQTIIQSGDIVKLSLVPGIGKKMAEKIILELRGKLAFSTVVQEATDADLVDALRSLGYNPGEIAAVMPKIPSSLASTNERITWILRHFAE